MNHLAQLIVALDFSKPQEALDLATRLRGTVNWVKIGLELFLAGGQSLLAACKDMEFSVFLDLKFMDIPNTVQAAVAQATSMDVDMLTIHALGGANMAKAALAGRDQGIRPGQVPPHILAVTVLTSLGPTDLVWNPQGSAKDLRALTVDLAKNSQNWGLDGVVCSGQEILAIRKHCPGSFYLLTPGIRMAGAQAADQTRVATPAQAVRDGSSFLVVGRPITRAADPIHAARCYIAEIEQSS